MAQIKRSTTNAALPTAKEAQELGGLRKAALEALTLPEDASEVSHNVSDYYFLIHGEKKIGKTTFTTVEEGVFLLTFDPIQKALAIKQRHVPDWDHLQKYIEMLETAYYQDNYPYKRVVVDGVDLMYRHCQIWAQKKLVVDHISEEKWGRGWDLLKETFMRTVDRLMALPGGCWFISHSEWREIQTRRGPKISKLLPNMKSAAEEILVGKVDGWFAYDYVGDERVLIILGDESTGAGHRIKGHFTTPRGRRVCEIPMGGDEQEAWKNFLRAFNNKQTFITLAERDEIAARKEAKARDQQDQIEQA